MRTDQTRAERCNEARFQVLRCWNVPWIKVDPLLSCFVHSHTPWWSNLSFVRRIHHRGWGSLPSFQSKLDPSLTRPLSEAKTGLVSRHVSLPSPAKGEHGCPRGKWKHLVLARPAHISAGPHELAGDACTEENRRPQRWPTSFLPHRPPRPQPTNTAWTCSFSQPELTKADLHLSELQLFYIYGFVFILSLWYCAVSLVFSLVDLHKLDKIKSKCSLSDSVSPRLVPWFSGIGLTPGHHLVYKHLQLLDNPHPGPTVEVWLQLKS